MSVLLTVVWALILCLSFAWSADRVVGANQVLGLDPGANSAGAGGATLAMPGSTLDAGLNPIGMLDLPSHAFGIAHSQQYEDTRLDAGSLVYALDSQTRAGVVFMRFGAEDIPWIKEGEELPADGEWKTLSIADYSLSMLVARKLPWKLEVAMGMHFLYRELDQTGFGFRGDAALRWVPTPKWFFAGKLDGWTSSAARWESGQVEYSPPELRLATGFHIPTSYLYGQLHLGYQSPGVLHHGNRWMSISNSVLSDTLASDQDEVSIGGGHPWETPWSWFKDGSAGVELEWDWGGAIRGGLQSLQEWDSWTVGGGIRFMGWLSVDYAYQRHPVLSGIHRVSLDIWPWWQKQSHVVTPVSAPVETAIPAETPQAEEIIEEEPQESDGKSWEE